MSPDDRVPTDHDALREICAGHALGCLDPADSIHLLSHLRRGCRECEREIEGYREAVTALGAALDPVEPPPAAEREFLERIQGGPRVGARPDHAAPSWMRAVLPVAALLIVSFSLWLAWDARRGSTALVQENRVLHEAVEAIPRESVRVYPLRGADGETGGWVVIQPAALDRPEQGWMLVHAALPPAPAGTAYHAWLRVGSEVRAVGRIDPDGDGYGYARISLPPETDVAGVFVTQEAAIDPNSPTGPVISEYRREDPD